MPFAENEPFLRLGVFSLVLGLMMVWEALAPRRTRSFGRGRRWPSNLGVSLINTVLVRLALPLGTTGFALFAESQRWGLFNQVVIARWAVVLTAVILLDFATYLQHLLFHAVGLLWRLHRMHHADLDFDVTTGVRFHPIEIAISVVLRLALIAVLGVPAVAVVTFEVLLNATSMLSHGNVNIPTRLDRLLRWVLVTPDMHRVHHSISADETNSNFGFNLAWWDRLFRTYRAEPLAGQLGMTVGIEQFRNPQELRLACILSQPFRSDSIDRQSTTNQNRLRARGALHGKLKPTSVGLRTVK